MRKPHVLSLLTCLLTLSCAVLSTAAEKPEKIEALVITGDDVAPAHDWREISDATCEVLAKSGRFNVRVCEGADVLDSADELKKYDVIVFLMFNRKLPMLSDAGKKNLLAFVEGGKGFYVQHLASASYKQWEEFGKLCGRHWVMGTSGHGPRSVFQCDISEVKHPITKGMKSFEISDELYAKLQGDEPIEVLVSADSDWSGRTEPIVFTRTYGNGRSVHNALGHDRKAITNAGCQTLIARGVEWAATGKVAGD